MSAPPHLVICGITSQRLRAAGTTRYRRLSRPPLLEERGAGLGEAATAPLLSMPCDLGVCGSLLQLSAARYCPVRFLLGLSDTGPAAARTHA